MSRLVQSPWLLMSRHADSQQNCLFIIYHLIPLIFTTIHMLHQSMVNGLCQTVTSACVLKASIAVLSAIVSHPVPCSPGQHSGNAFQRVLHFAVPDATLPQCGYIDECICMQCAQSCTYMQRCSTLPGDPAASKSMHATQSGHCAQARVSTSFPTNCSLHLYVLRTSTCSIGNHKHSSAVQLVIIRACLWPCLYMLSIVLYNCSSSRKATHTVIHSKPYINH